MMTFQSLSRLFGLAVLLLLLAACNFSSDSSDNGSTTTGTVDTATVNIDVDGIVRGVNGAGLSGAEVSINGASGISDRQGRTTVTAPVSESAEEVVVTARLQGFIPQSLRVPVAGLDTVQLIMQPIASDVRLQDITSSQVVAVPSMNASVSFADNSFVIAGTSTPATGEARVEITPWDIQGTDLLAMPGGGQALDVDNNSTLLISAGMMSVNFYNAAGDPLQLAEGKSADIQMDLPVSSIDGQAMTVGTEIPMWSFDQAKGLWLEDGTGVVTESSGSLHSLAVQATVTHFSTWNWDFKWSGGSTINARCIDSSGEGIDCSVVVDVTLPDGSKVTPFGGNSGFLVAAGTQIINMPNAATIRWQATTDTGLIGELVSDVEDVDIPIEAPRTSNFVQCLTDSGAPVACTVTLSVTEDGQNRELIQPIPQDGATIQTNWDVSNLNWTAQTGARVVNGEKFRLEGAQSSGATGEVLIALERVELGDAPQSLRVRCDGLVYHWEWETGTDYSETVPGETYDTCSVRVSTSPSGVWQQTLLYQSDALPANVTVTVALPATYSLTDTVRISGTARSQPSGSSVRDDYSRTMAELDDGELIELRMAAIIELARAVLRGSDAI